MSISKNGLRLRREQAGLSRERFARSIQPTPVSAALIAAMERGYRPGDEYVQRIAAALGCTPAELYEYQ